MIANRTTSIESSKTVGEIQQMLAAARASSLMIDYEDGCPSALSFRLTQGNQSLRRGRRMGESSVEVRL